MPDARLKRTRGAYERKPYYPDAVPAPRAVAVPRVVTEAAGLCPQCRRVAQVTPGLIFHCDHCCIGWIKRYGG